MYLLCKIQKVDLQLIVAVMDFAVSYGVNGNGPTTRRSSIDLHAGKKCLKTMVSSNQRCFAILGFACWKTDISWFAGALIRGAEPQGFGCAAGGPAWRDQRFEALSQWFCKAWRQHKIAQSTKFDLSHIEIGYVGVRLAELWVLGYVVFRLTACSKAVSDCWMWECSPANANSSLSGSAGIFFKSVSKEQIFQYNCY